MFENIIKFSARKDYIEKIFPEDYPEPVVKNIPNWFKDLEAKKVNEFEDAVKNLKLIERFNFINFRLKINYYFFQLRKLVNNISFKILKKRLFVQ